MIVLVGSVFVRTLGCPDGAGQDYFRIETASGIIEAHLAFNTSGSFATGTHWTIKIDNLALTGSFTTTFVGLAAARVNPGVTWDDIVCVSGGNAVVLHGVKGISGTWPVNTILNFGFLLG